MKRIKNSMASYKERLNHITTFLFDVDGVLTNGDVIIHNGELLRTLNSKDGYAMQYAVKKGYKIFIITGGNSEHVKESLEHLGVTAVFLRSSHKAVVYDKIKVDYNLVDSEMLYMGDDIPDIPVLQKVGLSTCPQDAVPEVKMTCHYQSPFLGGKGCVRDVIEQTLRVRNDWYHDDAFHW